LKHNTVCILDQKCSDLHIDIFKSEEVRVACAQKHETLKGDRETATDKEER